MSPHTTHIELTSTKYHSIIHHSPVRILYFTSDTLIPYLCTISPPTPLPIFYCRTDLGLTLTCTVYNTFNSHRHYKKNYVSPSLLHTTLITECTGMRTMHCHK